MATQLAGKISSAVVEGVDVIFFVTDESDEIQRYHAKGEFYEAEELQIIREYFPRGGTFVDVGSNVGNHAIFVSKFLDPAQIIVIEPNPPAIAILKVNILLNGLQRLVDTSNLGVGLSDTSGKAWAYTPPANLGATQLRIETADGPLSLIPGDVILQDRRVDFLKIDVEGMELKALAGLEQTISKWRPPMFVEVDDENAGSFEEWLETYNYEAIRKYRRYPVNENYMVVPKETGRNRASTVTPDVSAVPVV
jgi:FkbM family methyltransferase